MINPGTLDTLIAVVIVLLVLSLIVQSIQTVVKKLLKLKSRTILNSLEDLFINTIKPSNTKLNTTGNDNTAQSTIDARGLVKVIQEEFRKLGRENLRGKPMLDSIAKDDLIKVLKKLHPDYLVSGSETKIKDLSSAVSQLQVAISQIDAKLLSGDASAKFAALQESLAPLMNDIKSALNTDQLKPGAVLSDLLNLRQINLNEALMLLGEVQQKLEKDIIAASISAAAQKVNETGQNLRDIPIADKSSVTQNLDLLKVKTGLQDIAVGISVLSRSVDAALSPLRFKLNEIELWYDTVMQGFEERYSRNMRTISLVISFFVVIMLNANFFKVYNGISHNDIKRAVIVQAGEVLRDREKGSGAMSGPVSATNQNPQLTKQEINSYLNTYEEFGFSPLTPSQIHDYVYAAGTYAGSNPTNRLRYGFQVFIGWLIMTLLLSIGAPFWQDTLESLFGLKNLLRKKSDTKNVEDAKGGQPHP